MNLVELLKQPEGKGLEFKDLSSPDGVLCSLVVFANTAGGTLLIGVDDKTKHVRGIRAGFLNDWTARPRYMKFDVDVR